MSFFIDSILDFLLFRRHLPPPKTNFEKLQDLLKKRKGMDLDVSSSGALATSLDKCVVCLFPLFQCSLSIIRCIAISRSKTSSLEGSKYAIL